MSGYFFLLQWEGHLNKLQFLSAGIADTSLNILQKEPHLSKHAEISEENVC